MSGVPAAGSEQEEENGSRMDRAALLWLSCSEVRQELEETPLDHLWLGRALGMVVLIMNSGYLGENRPK